MMVSGKSHTMEGTDTDPGIIPFSFRHIFDKIGRSTSTNPVRIAVLSLSLSNLRCLRLAVPVLCS
jgi:hypothetical protein